MRGSQAQHEDATLQSKLTETERVWTNPLRVERPVPTRRYRL